MYNNLEDSKRHIEVKEQENKAKEEIIKQLKGSEEHKDQQDSKTQEVMELSQKI